jgi:hypothetical protein
MFARQQTLYQRGPEDYTLETIVFEVESGRVISKSLMDVLVYDRDPVTQKPKYIPKESLEVRRK